MTLTRVSRLLARVLPSCILFFHFTLKYSQEGLGAVTKITTAATSNITQSL